MVASSGARLLERTRSTRSSTRLFPLATVVTPNADEATALVGPGDPAEQARRLVELGAAAAIVTGGGAGDHFFDGETALEIPSPARRRPRRTAPAARTPRRSRRCSRAAKTCSRAAALAAATASDAVAHGLDELGSGEGPVDVFHLAGRAMSDSPGAALRDLRERKPLIHQITNYVVMNETANATLAIGALPVMAHARRRGRGDGGRRRARSCSTSARSRGHWIDAMLLAGKAANAAGVPVVLDPVGVGATTLRTDTAKRILDEVDVAIVRGNAAEVAALAGSEGGDPRRRGDRSRRGRRDDRAHRRDQRSVSSPR